MAITDPSNSDPILTDVNHAYELARATIRPLYGLAVALRSLRFEVQFGRVGHGLSNPIDEGRQACLELADLCHSKYELLERIRPTFDEAHERITPDLVRVGITRGASAFNVVLQLCYMASCPEKDYQPGLRYVSPNERARYRLEQSLTDEGACRELIVWLEKEWKVARLMATGEVGTTTTWSSPRSPKQLAKLFNRSWPTVKRMIEQRKIRAQKLSTKSYRIHIGDLPNRQ